MITEAELEEITLSMTKYDLPVRYKWDFAHLGYCVTHKIFYALIKRIMVSDRTFRNEIIVDPAKNLSHINKDCYYIMNEREFIATYWAFRYALDGEL